MTVDGRLQRLLGGSDLAALRERLRRRFEGNEVLESLQISGLTAGERAALAQLAGKPPSDSKSIVLDVRALDEALSAAGIASSLREALECLDGPIVDRAVERERHRATWAQVASDCDHQALQAWLGSPATLGLLKRLSRNDASQASAVLARAASVLRRLPCAGIPRAQLAAEVLGDAHGLDSSRPVATIVLSVLRAGRRSAGPEEDQEDARDRSVWASAGVLVNELAKPALCLNLPCAEFEGHGRRHGSPTFYSLRDLVREQPTWQVAGRTVFVCENPNLLAIAADRLESQCAPLVCTDGMPAAAQWLLLGQLATAGAELVYHGDFDWPGLRIADYVLRSLPAKPWRLGAQDYLAAVAQAQEKAPLSARPVAALWNEELAGAMVTAGVAIAEEAVFESLAVDLACAAVSGA